MSLRGRRAVVEVGTLIIEGLTVKFSISMSATEIGKAEISVINLNSTHRDEIAKQEAVDVSLSVGYEDEGLELIFKGDIREAFSMRESPGWVTTFRTGDGDKAAQARINESFSPGTKFETVLNATVKALEDSGIGAGNAYKLIKEGKFKEGLTELFNGGAFQGKALDKLRKLGRAANLDVGIQNKELQLTEIDMPLGTAPVLLSPSSGLIGSPQKGAKGLIKVRSLIIPGLRPKRKIQVESKSFSGTYMVQKVKYKGDTSSNDWYADLECKETA